MSITIKLLDGQLHRGLANPRRVIFDPTKRTDIIRSVHYSDNKCHADTTECLRKLSSDEKVIWPNMTREVSQFVRECVMCAAARDDFDKENENAEGGGGRGGGVWRFTHVHVHGPFLEDKYVLTIRDPSSRWIVARMFDLSSHSDLLSALANFIFSSLCQYGFARCRVFLRGEHEYEAVKDVVAARIEALASSLAPAEKLALSVDDILEHSAEETCCERLSETLSHLVGDCSSDWDSMLDSWLFSQRTNVQSSGRTPFSILFNRDPLGIFGNERTHHVESVKAAPSSSYHQTRRTLKSSRLQCRHCDDVFTSRVSFKLHQKRHIEEAMRVGAMKGQKASRSSDGADDEGGNEMDQSADQDDEDQLFVCPRKPKRWERKRLGGFNPRTRIAKLKASEGLASARRRRNKVGKNGAGKIDEDFDDPEEVNEVAESAVSIMKELLEATKEARSKRGKYAKFSLELQDEIAAFAIRHGVAPTLAYYSRRFEHNTLTEGSIRNFVRAHRRFPPSLKENVGKVAYQYGSEKALQIFRKKRSDLGDGLNAVVVRKFRRYFLNKNPNLVDNDASSSATDNNDGCLAIFGEPLRDEIGHFAFQFGNVPAVEKFSARLQFPMQESTVRKFKRAWMAKNNVAEIPRQNDQDEQVVVPDLTGKSVAALNISNRATDDGDGGDGTSHFGEQSDGNNQGQASNLNHIVLPAEFSSNLNFDQQQQTMTTGASSAADTRQQLIFQDRSSAGVANAPLSLTINATEEVQPQQQRLINLCSAPAAVGFEEGALPVQTAHGLIPIIIQDESGGQTTTTLTVTLSTEEDVAAAEKVRELPEVKEAVSDSDDDEFVEEVSSRGRPVKRKVLKSRKKTRTKKVKVREKEEGGGKEASKKSLAVAERAPMQRKSEKARKRTYTTYDPELRAKIGRYAMAGHGNQETIDHFKEVYGVELPESTVRLSYLCFFF